MKGCLLTLVAFLACSVYGLMWVGGREEPDRVRRFASPDGQHEVMVEFWRGRYFMGNSDTSGVSLKDVHAWPFYWENVQPVVYFRGEPELDVQWQDNRTVVLVHVVSNASRDLQIIANPRGPVTVKIREIPFFDHKVKALLN